ncbi:LysE/ArgO family amino acid transporter [Xanthomonas maliensis]|uniref:LysE/ArgO family amino acid transporter n=1 Tax=Xanthomonas maliensis TaxID=1321368 RepID=UPI0004CF1BAA|nr:LysE/ArgO family amino acid transporter [Xanthomonas maliensis]KAB7772311.1 amino acid transporter [Xanthomonas maliensis]
MATHTLLAGFLAGAGLIVAIGAQNAFVLRQGLQRRHVGVVVAICALCDICLITLGVAGVGALIARWPGVLIVLRYAGAAFLAGYGLLAARRAWQGAEALAPAESATPGDGYRIALTCLAFTFLNPHVYLDTMVLLGSLANRHAGDARWVFAAGACLASVSWFAALGYGARTLQPVFRDQRAWRVLDAAIATLMLVLCGLLVWPGTAPGM